MSTKVGPGMRVNAIVRQPGPTVAFALLAPTEPRQLEATRRILLPSALPPRLQLSSLCACCKYGLSLHRLANLTSVARCRPLDSSWPSRTGRC